MNVSIFNSGLVILGTALALLALFHPRVVNSKTWLATITPLASIIGSGFLVLGPILKHGFGFWGILVMAALCAVAYAFGHAIRFNIACYDNLRAQGQSLPTVAVERTENLASYTLVFAYVISITYYLNLFGAFAVSLTPVDDRIHARIVTSGVLVFICLLGWWRGFQMLERIEEGTVGLKLAIIIGLLIGLTGFGFERMSGDGPDLIQPSTFDWRSIAVALGLVITVQGFETSRYLESEYDAETRIRTMKLAQWIASGVYLVYISLITVYFSNEEVPNSETGIVGMTRLVAPVLPALLVAAALAAQFSAAVADTGGCGGSAQEVTHKKLSARTSYLLIGAMGLVVTWTADIYSIISYASRAFAVYYGFQCVVALLFARRIGKVGKVAFFGMLAILALLIVVFGRSAE